MRQKLLFTLVFVSAAFLASAQKSQMKEWKWFDWNTKFKVPTNLNVRTNNADEFSAGDENMFVSVFPKFDRKMSVTEMRSALEKWAADQKVKFEGRAKDMTNLNRYAGVYIDGTGSNGLPTTLLLLGDPDYKRINLYIWVQYNEKFVDTAVEIIKSFVPN